MDRGKRSSSEAAALPPPCSSMRRASDGTSPAAQPPGRPTLSEAHILRKTLRPVSLAVLTTNLGGVAVGGRGRGRAVLRAADG